jgi:hypothetical protein
MTAANATSLELLGKQVSFISVFPTSPEVYEIPRFGLITTVAISLDGQVEICLDDTQFYVLSELKDFVVKN